MKPRNFWVALALVLIAAVVVVSSREQAPTAFRDQGAAPSSAAPPNVSATDPEGATTRRAQHPLEEYLLAEAEPSRDSVLLSMIRDTGLPCDGILNATQLTENTATWRVSCGSAHVYLVEVDRFGEVRVEPLFYGDQLGPALPLRDPSPREIP